ncbi:hypothetical protein O3P69_019322 [Scylla paramamosain]|uniref:PID domain-containing protein n=1 Tax=Scylla paramamosain TaxID=85552 RepID=A0AAW0SW81_SCYPA
MRQRGPAEARVRKASYYVWFLGAGECRGLRGVECVRPVLAALLARERATPPDKVTLQVSGRGVRVLAAGDGGAAPSRHFIPAAAITYVQQEARPEDDLVSCVLLVYNPATRCPVHLHAYRCDSTQTAALLRRHLAQLAGRPDHQAKLAALEARLHARGLPLPPCPPCGATPPTQGSDGASTGSSSSGGGGSGTGGTGGSGGGVSSLYDSLAAELREKLGGRGAPLLLPPRDYDSPGGAPPNPRKGAATTPSTPAPQDDDQATRSSGIGSDHHSTPSPTHEPDDDDDDWLGYDPHPPHPQPPPPPPPPTCHPHHRSPPAPPTTTTTTPPDQPAPPEAAPDRWSPPCEARRPPPDTCPPSASPSSPRERFQDAREKFRSLERWGAPPSHTPPPWEGSTPPPRHAPRAHSPVRGRSPTREWRGARQRSPEREQQYQRARSMHDLSGRRGAGAPHPDAPHDPRRRSLYEGTEEGVGGRGPRRYRSHASLGGRRASSPSPSSCCSSSSAGSYAPLPEARRPPGLDRATARPDPLEGALRAGPLPMHAPLHHHHHHHPAAPRRTFDYPVNGGTAPLHMARAPPPPLDDAPPQRRPRPPPPQFVRGAARY